MGPQSWTQLSNWRRATASYQFYASKRCTSASIKRNASSGFLEMWASSSRCGVNYGLQPVAERFRRHQRNRDIREIRLFFLLTLPSSRESRQCEIKAVQTCAITMTASWRAWIDMLQQASPVPPPMLAHYASRYTKSILRRLYLHWASSWAKAGGGDPGLAHLFWTLVQQHNLSPLSLSM